MTTRQPCKANRILTSEPETRKGVARRSIVASSAQASSLIPSQSQYIDDSIGAVGTLVSQ
jgi:hypothetical protein